MLYVMATLVPVVFWLANDKGGVKDMLVSLDLVHIVPFVFPQVYVIVCVKLVACRVTVSVCAVPSVPFATESVDFRGIVVSVFVAEAETVPELTPEVYEAETDRFFVPSDSCAMFNVFVNRLPLPLAVCPVLKGEVKVYFVPSMVHEPDFSRVLYEPPVHFALTFTVTFEVLFAMFWLFCVMSITILTDIF